MDPKKKKIYIIAGIATLVLSAGILIWSMMDFSSETALEDSDVPNSIPINEATGDASGGFLPPSVFPTTDTMKTGVLEDATYKSLQPYTTLDVTNQLGRPNPFQTY